MTSMVGWEGIALPRTVPKAATLKEARATRASDVDRVELPPRLPLAAGAGVATALVMSGVACAR